MIQSKNYLIDDYFKTTLFPEFQSSSFIVCNYMGFYDEEYGVGKTAYSDLCGDIYNMIKACHVGNSGSYETLEAVLNELTDRETILKETEKFVQAILCYYILCTDENYKAEMEKHREEFLNRTKEEEGMGSRNETEIKADDQSVSSWDEYYYNIAFAIASNSKCLSRKIGVVMVRDKSIIGSGYNGPPRGIPRCDERWDKDGMLLKSYYFKSTKFPLETEDEANFYKGKCPRQVMDFKSGQGMEYCIASHAEESTITNCARMGVQTKGSIMYMTCGIPCYNCMITIINAGIKELVVTDFNYYDKLSKYLLENSDVKVRKFDFLN